MDLQPINVRLYCESMDRIKKSSPEFLDNFYRHFITSNIEIAATFHRRDAERIKHKLNTTLEMLADSANSVPGTSMYLELLGRIHERRHVTLEHFSCWKTALLDSVAECDANFNELIRDAWQEVINTLLKQMCNEIHEDMDASQSLSHPQIQSTYAKGVDAIVTRHF